MIIEYDIHCFERTLRAHFTDELEPHREEILQLLDEYYYQWHDYPNISDPVERGYAENACLEEYMMTMVSEKYPYEMWGTIYYGDEEEE
jgi:hypothetical protein